MLQFFLKYKNKIVNYFQEEMKFCVSSGLIIIIKSCIFRVKSIYLLTNVNFLCILLINGKFRDYKSLKSKPERRKMNQL